MVPPCRLPCRMCRARRAPPTEARRKDKEKAKSGGGVGGVGSGGGRGDGKAQAAASQRAEGSMSVSALKRAAPQPLPMPNPKVPCAPARLACLPLHDAGLLVACCRSACLLGALVAHASRYGGTVAQRVVKRSGAAASQTSRPERPKGVGLP
jgi:hypothetical protein